MRTLVWLAVVAFGCSVPPEPEQPHPDADLVRLDAMPSDAATTPWQPSGKGLWIWYFEYTGLTARAAAEHAASNHVGFVLIKSGEDGNFWSTLYTADVVREFTSRNIAVFAWPYVTPGNVDDRVAAIAQAAAVPGTSGIVLDAEIEFEGNHAANARALCRGIRAAAPDVWLGYTSFGWVGYHNTFPFEAFDQDCGDGFFPQVYWSERGVSWQDGLTEALSMIQSAHLHAPVWPIESNGDTPDGNWPATEELDAFFAQAGAHASMWELPSAAEIAAGKLDQLDALHWANP